MATPNLFTIAGIYLNEINGHQYYNYMCFIGQLHLKSFFYRFPTNPFEDKKRKVFLVIFIKLNGMVYMNRDLLATCTIWELFDHFVGVYILVPLRM